MANTICFVDNHPESPNVTVNETNIQFDGAAANWVNEEFVLADVSAENTITLASYPVSPDSVIAFLNSGAQLNGTDYTVNGNIVTLNFTMLGDDKLLIRYFAYEGANSLGSVAIGSILWQATTTIPTGYCAADGTTSYARANYGALYNHANGAGLILTSTATHFTLKDLGIGPTAGGTTLYAIIKN